MLVAQLTDLHLGPDDDPVCAGNFTRLQRCIDTLTGFLQPPDAYVITGDISEYGDRGSYELFFSEMSRIERPWLCIGGNHDDARVLREVAAAEAPGRFVSDGVLKAGTWRIVCADTARAGQHGGYFDEVRAARLDAVLAREPEAPTIVAIHHPPIETGVGWIDPDPASDWIARLGDAVVRHGQVAQIICGHAHMPAIGRLRGIPVTIAPATAPQIWPEMAATQRSRADATADGRTLVIDGVPGFALHRLGPTGVSTVFGSPPTGRVRLRSDAAKGERRIMA